MEALIIEDINSSYFGNQKAWLLFCSYMDNNTKVNQGSSYDYFESLVSGQYPYIEAHEAETKITKTRSLPNDKEAYLFDRQTRELYSGSASDIQALIKQPNSLAILVELNDETHNNSDLISALPIDKDSTLLESKFKQNLLKVTFIKMAIVWFGFGLILFVPLGSAMNSLQSISRFFFSPPTNSVEEEKLKAEVDKLILEDHAAELSHRPQPLRVINKQKSECEKLNK